MNNNNFKFDLNDINLDSINVNYVIKRFIIIALTILRTIFYILIFLFCVGCLTSFIANDFAFNFVDDFLIICQRVRILAVLCIGAWISNHYLKKNRAQLEEMKAIEKISAFNKERN